MTVKYLVACSGLDFSYNPTQVVEGIDPVVGADHVKHGLAVELDADGNEIVPVAEDTNQDEDPDKAGSEDSEDSDEDKDPSNESSESDEETAQLSGDGEASNPDESGAETANVETPATETADAKPVTTRKK